MELLLYVVAGDGTSDLIQQRLKKICTEYLHDNYELQVIDIALNPDQADTQDIIAVPTVIRNLPLPERRVIGDLSNERQTVVGLGFSAHLGEA